MNPIRIISTIIILASLIGGGALLYYYSLDSANAETLFFQVGMATAAVMFLSGIGLAILSKKKPNFINDIMQGMSKKSEIPKDQFAQAAKVIQPIQYVNAPAMNAQAKGDVSIHSLPHPMKSEGGLAGSSPVKELSFDEEMALRKKQYYESKTTIERVEEKVAAPPPIQAAPSPTPQKQPGPVPGKITLKFESPFGKKKPIDPLRTILNQEEESAGREAAAPWKSR
jgi:hypothetical protein